MKILHVLVFTLLLAYNIRAEDEKFERENIKKSEYSYSYSNFGGLSKKTESGGFNDNNIFTVTGEYQFLYEGRTYLIKYVADEKGYHPVITISDELPLYFMKPVADYNPNIVATLLG